MHDFISSRSRACGTRTCWACGARTTSTPRIWRPSPGSSTWGRRSPIARWQRWWPTPRSMRSGCADRSRGRPPSLPTSDRASPPAIDALWVCGPNFARVDNFEEIADTIARGKGELRGIACEKPLGRNVAEAKRVLELTKKAGIAHGYLENQAFAPAVAQGRAIIWARGPAPRPVRTPGFRDSRG